MKNNNQNNDEVNEHGLSYGTANKRLVFFNSFEEENEYNAKQAALEDPVIRLKNTVDLILRTYGFTHESLAKRIPSDKIFIDKA